MNITGSRPVSLGEAKEIIEERKKDGELGYEQSQAFENAERFAKADSKKAKKLVEAIKDVGKLSEELALKIIDIYPTTSATLRAILVKDKIELSEDEINKILKELG